MSKTTFKPGTMLNPVPAVMVSCGSKPGEENIITIAWTGIVNSEPPITYVSVQRSRFSHDVIEREGEFVINLTTEALTRAADFCGVRSGRNVDKFAELSLTKEKADLVKCPMIAESPVNLECRVLEMKAFPTHDMFLAEIISVHVDTSLMDENGRLELERAGLVAYSHGEYFGLQKRPLGRFGYSVMKPKTKKRIAGERRQKYRKKEQKDGRK
ncbi:flavin reductase family protein [Bacilliculturomica massiliensis]|uniref:flavin reductase family protein n=1 Tax=Bacilliculturomica massiliensis TaxID=1917867 RepID=UPI0010312340|nr:flavin reductase family protein [Bacilliculturomica massiliensis]